MRTRGLLRALYALSLSIFLADGCDHGLASRSEMLSLAAKNNAHRRNPHRSRSVSIRTVINNVRVFNGDVLQPPSTVIISDGKIDYPTADTTGATIIDAQNATLLPGLIDSHTHPTSIAHLQELASYGVTTAMVMACFEPKLCTSLQNITGLPDLRRGTAPAAAPESTHGNINGQIDPTLNIANTSQVTSWVKRELAGNPDFVKIVTEEPGLSQQELTEITKLSHQAGKKVVCHSVTTTSFNQAIAAGVDQIHHAPLDQPACPEIAEAILRGGQVLCPTLTMMRNTAAAKPSTDHYNASLESVRLFHESGIPILAGTDANEQKGVPAMVPFGISLHQELENLVEAGMSNVEALRAATVLPARQWGLCDRGEVRPGMRADLILVEGNPVENITVTRNIRKVWIAGVEYTEMD